MRWRIFPGRIACAALLAVLPSPTFGQGNGVQKGAAIPQGRTAAQTAAESRLNRPVSNGEIASAISRSGLSHDQVRARLQAAGYDPALADPFFVISQASTSVLQSSDVFGVQALETTSSFGDAFRDIGVFSSARSAGAGEATGESSNDRGETTATTIGGEAAAAPSASVARVFGRNVFAGAASAFAVVTGPVDPAYRLGAGDQLQFVLTGDVESAYQIDVRQDGTVLVPQLGQVHIGGLTLDGARGVLRRRSGQVYSGIHSGNTRLDVSVSRVRTNAVFVIGEVERPGAYVVNGLATMFHAIARAGGPNDRGSFRAIEVRRGEQVIRKLDLYDYLLKGDPASDIRAEQADVIFVPLSRRTIRVTGEVRRPATFELLPGEGFRELLVFSGGTLATASLDRVQIDRVLPPEKREPGRERVLIDVKIQGNLDSLAAVPLEDGDVVTVFSVGELRRNTVNISGAVLRAGTYELTTGVTLGELIRNSQGLLPWALMDRVKLTRWIPATGKSAVLSLDLSDPFNWDFRLQEFDHVTVLDRRVSHPAEVVHVAGEVFRPGTLRHSEKLTLQDVIDLAGGFKPSATSIELSRRREQRNYSDTTSVVTTLEVDSALTVRGGAMITLRPDDRVFVRSAPGFRAQRFVELSGMFRFPGVYPIIEDKERISSIIRRAGGLLPDAHVAGFRVTRQGRPLAIDLERSLRGDVRHDLPVLDGDRIRVGPDLATVLVTGEVFRTVIVRYQRGTKLKDYVTLAGGAKPDGDVKAAVVEDASGGVDRVRRQWLLLRRTPEIESGSTIVIPQRPEKKNTISSVVATTVSYTSAIASLALAYTIIVRR